MQVETYEIEEINSSEAATMACDAVAMELVEKLGLTGQMKLQNPETGTRLPYRKLTALENLIFTTLFPTVTKLEAYESGIIPLRVLQVAAHCKENQFFTELRVWHPADVKRDPVLIGWQASGEYSWIGENFLLARWGDALENMEQLAAKAARIWTAEKRAALLEIKCKLDGDITNLDAIAAQAFADGKIPHLTYSA